MEKALAALEGGAQPKLRTCALVAQPEAVVPDTVVALAEELVQRQQLAAALLGLVELLRRHGAWRRAVTARHPGANLLMAPLIVTPRYSSYMLCVFVRLW